MCEVSSLTNRVLAALGCLMLMFATSTISAQENSDERLQNSAELIIRVSDIEHQRGNLNIAIIRSPDAYERFMSPPKEGEQGPEPAQGLIVTVMAGWIRIFWVARANPMPPQLENVAGLARRAGTKASSTFCPGSKHCSYQ